MSPKVIQCILLIFGILNKSRLHLFKGLTDRHYSPKHSNRFGVFLCFFWKFPKYCLSLHRAFRCTHILFAQIPTRITTSERKTSINPNKIWSTHLSASLHTYLGLVVSLCGIWQECTLFISGS